jgi:hypothetical protein
VDGVLRMLQWDKEEQDDEEDAMVPSRMMLKDMQHQ